MFIPVSLNTGMTAVDCVVDVTGVLNAQCEVIHNAISYFPNVDIPVVKGDTVQLRTNITEYAQIAVSLAGRLHYWYVDLPKSLRYIEDLAFERITGNTYGKIYSGDIELDYVESGTLSRTDNIVSSIDYVKKEIWFFGENAVKKIATPDKPIAVVYTPRWSPDENIETSWYVVTETTVYALNADLTLNLDTAQRIDTNGLIRGACGANDGILLISDTHLSRFASSVTVVAELGGHAVKSTYQNQHFVGTATGTIEILSGSDGNTSSQLIYNAKLNPNVEGPSTAKFVIDANHANYMFAIDMTNRVLLSFTLANSEVNVINLEWVPSCIVSHEDNVYVGFFDHPQVFKYTADLVFVEAIDTVKAQGINFGAELIVTDLYADAEPVTTEEPEYPFEAEYLDVPVEASVVQDIQIPWERPRYLRLLSPNATATLDGQPFTAGFVAAPSVLTLTLPSDGEYYAESQIVALSDSPIVVRSRTEPKLFPTPVTLSPVYDAFIKRKYEDIFMVEGMTDGFTVDVSTDSGDMEFSINDGEYATTGTIQNGDIVEVRATIRNMITKRNQHDIVTEYDKPVSLWTILVMQLEGTEFRRDTTQWKDKFADRFETDTTNEQQYTIDVSRVANRILSPDGYLPVVQTTMLTTQTTEPLLAITSYAELQGFDAAVETSRILEGSVDSIHTSTRIVEGESQSSMYSVSSIYEFDVSGVICATRIVEDSVDHLYTKTSFAESSVTSEFDATRIVELNVQHEIDDNHTYSVDYRHVIFEDSYGRSVDSVYSIVSLQPELYYEVVPNIVHINHTALPSEYLANQSSNVEEFSTLATPVTGDARYELDVEHKWTRAVGYYEFGMNPFAFPGHVAVLNVVHEHANMQHTWEVNQEFVRLLYRSLDMSVQFDVHFTGKPNDQDMSYTRFLAGHSEELLTSYEFTRAVRVDEFSMEAPIDTRVKILEYSSEHDLVNNQRSIDWVVGYELTSGRTEVTQQTVAEIQNGISALYGDNVVLFDRHSSLSIPMPEHKWVMSVQSDGIVPDSQTGYFETISDAEQYAQSLNLKENTPAEYYQHNEDWLFVSTPVTDNAACFPTTAPAQIQRRFGYAGGG
jgi:hypothetical protein